jgi:hypothetical protein
MCSHKSNKAAWRYEICLAIHEPQCLWINGPYKAGTGELTIFRKENGLKSKLQGMSGKKKLVVDRGYTSSEPDEIHLLSIPENTDSEALRKFKTRARMRHETFNGRVKNFKAIQDVFRHSRVNHKTAFEASCVIVQYQMDNGNPIFSV